jgi:carbon monoxide dehydrogenase subunit G
MEFKGRYHIAAPPQLVWVALNDPEVLKLCIPGCEQVEKSDDTHFGAVATLKVGPVKATFKAKIELADLDPPNRCTLKGEGQGGVAGFARGEAVVELAPDGNGTLLSYAATANIGGKLAQIGQRLIDGAAKQIADDFFNRFSATVSANATQTAPAPVTTADVGTTADASFAQVPPSQANDDARPEKKEGLSPHVWVVALLASIVALLAAFGASFRR